MKKAALPLLLLLLTPGVLPAQGPASFAVRPAESNVSFTVKKWGVLDVNGRFPQVSGSLQYDAGKPQTARVVIRVGVASVATGAGARDQTLQSEDFFDARRYPEMTFVSAEVTPTGKDAALVTGDLTIRGVTRRIQVPVKLLGVSRDGDRELAGFETDFTIDRREFGVLGARWSGGRALISNEVRIHLAIGAARGRT